MLQKLGDIDLLIQDDDLVLDAIGVPVLVTGRACIVQDIKHMLREKQYMVQMVANRDKAQRSIAQANIESEIESDPRIKPGTARVTELTAGKYLIAATSLTYGPIDFDYSLTL